MSGGPGSPGYNAPGYNPPGTPLWAQTTQQQAQLAQVWQQIEQTLNAILTVLKGITPALRQGSAQATITAHAGGGQASATQLSAQFNEIDTVANAADSVALPVSAAGLLTFIANNGAHSLQVFGVGTDTINGVAAGTGVALPAGHAAAYFCALPGAWWSVPTAP